MLTRNERSASLPLPITPPPDDELPQGATAWRRVRSAEAAHPRLGTRNGRVDADLGLGRVAEQRWRCKRRGVRLAAGSADDAGRLGLSPILRGLWMPSGRRTGLKGVHAPRRAPFRPGGARP